MADKKQSALQKNLSASFDKAVRRGKKLEKTLLKIVAQSEAGSHAEELLKSIQAGVKRLKKEAKELERSLAPDSKKKPAAQEPAPKQARASKKLPRIVKRSSEGAPLAAAAEPAKQNTPGE